MTSWNQRVISHTQHIHCIRLVPIGCEVDEAGKQQQKRLSLFEAVAQCVKSCVKERKDQIQVFIMGLSRKVHSIFSS